MSLLMVLLYRKRGLALSLVLGLAVISLGPVPPVMAQGWGLDTEENADASAPESDQESEESDDQDSQFSPEQASEPDEEKKESDDQDSQESSQDEEDEQPDDQGSQESSQPAPQSDEEGEQPDGQEPGLSPQPEELEAEERIRRQEAELRAEQLVAEANRAFRENKFQDAVEKYRRAQDILKEAGNTDRIKRKEERIKDHLYNVTTAWARHLTQEARRQTELQKYDDALEKANKAGEIAPEKQEKVDQLRRKIIQRKENAKQRTEVQKAGDKIDKEISEEEHEIDILLEKGKAYYKNEKYDQAKAQFRKILKQDAFHAEALKYLRQANRELRQKGTERKYTTVEERMAEVRWTWSEPVTTMEVTPPDDQPAEVVEKDKREELRAKLKDIILPEINFKNARITDVVQFLQEKSVELDPDGEGVNFLLQLESTGEEGASEGGGGAGSDSGSGGGPGFPGAESGSEGGFDFEEGGGAATEETEEPEDVSASELPRVTMNMRNIPLQKVIDYVTNAANLQYMVDTNAVIIAAPDVPLERMETRTYSLQAGVLEGQRKVGGEEMRFPGSGDDDDDDDDDDGGGGGLFGGDDDDDDDDDGEEEQVEALSSGELQSFFQNFGVAFPQGSRIGYYARGNKLFVYNTPENLKRLEDVLDEIDEPPAQVSIEAKFVEINQTDLEELGFEWLFRPANRAQDSWRVLEGSGDSHLSVDKMMPGDPSISNALRYPSEMLPSVNAGEDELLSLSGILGNVEFNTVVQALDQKESTEVLSAPRVTALSGEVASIGVVTRRYFPDSYTEPELQTVDVGEGDARDYYIQPSHVDGWNQRDIGVMLEVMPRVGPDKYTVQLQLNPMVREFIEYDRSFNYDIQLGGQEVTVQQQRAIFSERRVNTQVIVWDGETVVLGGLIKEDTQRFEDKVPLLGDLPVVGRLFTTTGRQANKRNLLIFVSARLVDPAGAPLRATQERGIPDFDR